ncbi:MAG: chloride channel protein [Acidimicrobiales bacterium]
MTMPADPHAVLRTPGYLRLLVLAAIIGAPIAAAAYGFLWLVDEAQDWLYTDLPNDLGFDGEPTWWPLPLLALAGLLVGLTIRYLPGKGGESPADGFQPGRGAPSPIELPSIFLAALAGLSLGVVIGPEAPLIALGGGLGVCAIRLASRDVPPRTESVVAAAGSFGAISTLLGSPLLGAFLLMEASGLAGATMALVLVPGLVAAGVGSLIFVGLDSWTGLGTFSLVIPDLPAVGSPTVAEFGWAIAIGLAAAIVGTGIRMLALFVRPHIEPRTVLLTPVVGLAIAGLAIGFAEATDKSSSLVLFSGQSALGPVLENATSYSVGTLVLLIICKGLAYGVALSSFRGGPIFPAMFLGAVGGVALSHLPGLDMVAGAAMGIGAMTAAMLKLPMTSVLLATLLLLSSGLDAMPLVIIAVAVAYVASERLRPSPAAAEAPTPAAATAPSPGDVPVTPTH